MKDRSECPFPLPFRYFFFALPRSSTQPFSLTLDSTSRFARDPRWSETGDRYIIKLFRDYVFHQVDEAGRPVVDLGHVLGCLNKVPFFLSTFYNQGR